MRTKTMPEKEHAGLEDSSHESNDRTPPASAQTGKVVSSNADSVAFRKPIEDLRPRIETRAYEIYERRGRQNGRDLEDWLEAERETLKTA